MNCPRCTRPPLRSHDELFCLIHGTFYEPKRAWDTPGRPLGIPGRQCVRYGTAGPELTEWTPMERHVWKTWEEGDPVNDLGCPDCDRIFESVSGLGLHRSKKHGIRGRQEHW